MVMQLSLGIRFCAEVRFSYVVTYVTDVVYVAKALGLPEYQVCLCNVDNVHREMGRLM